MPQPTRGTGNSLVPGYSAGPSGAVAENSTVTGEGLSVGTTRQTSEFVITAKDAQGVRCTTGGENFFVFARGTARVRAYVTDNADGTYTVQWRVCSPQTRATDHNSSAPLCCSAPQLSAITVRHRFSHSSTLIHLFFPD